MQIFVLTARAEANGGQTMTKVFNYYGKDIEVSEEVYEFLIRDAWREKKRKARLSRCIGDGGNRCTKRCSECLRTRDGMAFSLEQTMDECQEIAAPDSVEHEVIENEIHAEVFASYQKLDATDRAILALRHDGLKDKAIAEVLGMKQTTVSYRKRKAISILLGRHGEDI